MTMIKQNFTIEKTQMDELRRHCKKTGLKMSTVVRCGLILYFELLFQLSPALYHSSCI